MLACVCCVCGKWIGNAVKKFMKHYGFEWWTSMYLYQNRMVLHTKCFPTRNVFRNNNRWKRRRRCWCCWLFFSSRFQSTEISFSLHLNVSFFRRLLVHVVIAMTNIDRAKWYGAQHTYRRVSFHQNLLISLCGSAIYLYIVHLQIYIERTRNNEHIHTNATLIWILRCLHSQSVPNMKQLHNIQRTALSWRRRMLFLSFRRCS